jgi:hypothetical protein
VTAAVAPVHDAILDAAAVAQLVFDVEHAGELLGLTVKPAGARRAAPAAVMSLAEAHRALIERSVAGIQLRYRFRGEEWWDTLLCAPTGIRLIRINHSVALTIDPDAVG